MKSAVRLQNVLRLCYASEFMASPLDNWSPSTRATCFRRFAQDLKEQSKGVFVKDKSHHEMFFFVSDDGKAAVMPAPADMDRDKMVDQLRQKIRENNIYGFVFSLQVEPHVFLGGNLLEADEH